MDAKSGMMSGKGSDGSMSDRQESACPGGKAEGFPSETVKNVSGSAGGSDGRY